MSGLPLVSRRKLLQSGAFAATAALAPRIASAADLHAPLTEFAYGDVTLAPGPQQDQLDQCKELLMALPDDALLKPFRQTAGLPSPGDDLGGWYRYDPKFDFRGGDAGFAPAATFGQWVSALARIYAITGEAAVRERVLRLNRLFREAISGNYFEATRFPAYSYDKLVGAMVDSSSLARDPEAFSILEKTTTLALPHLPPRAVQREKIWRTGKDVSYTWDESYTLPENLLLASTYGAGDGYRTLGRNYLEDETYFNPLARGQDTMAGRHAYSYVNALSSAMQAYLTLGSEKHLLAATNGFQLLTAQSFATGGWGPDELLRDPHSDDLYTSLSNSHHSFEAPCGSYAHFKLTRYLLRVTRAAHYGDSMERVMYNTVLGAKPLMSDGRAFYYADYHFAGRRVYSDHRWPCCSGTLPEVAADYRLNAYFHDGRDLWVNLYLPSTVKWKSEGVDLALSQQGEYPLEEEIHFTLQLSRPSNFALLLRIPAWANGASISVNGKPVQGRVVEGSFFRIQRQWRSGDRLLLHLPLELRLEPIHQRHPETVALLRGPLVLFALGNPPASARKQLLAASRKDKTRWVTQSSSGTLEFMPFSQINDAIYSTYLSLT